MIRSFVKNAFSRKLFNKLFLLYSVIIVLTFIILLIIVSAKVTSVITEQDISFNHQVIQTVDDYFAVKCRQLKNAMISLYQDAYAKPGAGTTGKDVLAVLRNYTNSDIVNNVEYQQSIYKYINDKSFNLDQDLNSVSIMSIGSGKVYTSWRRVINPSGSVLTYIQKNFAVIDLVKPRIYYTSVLTIDNYSKMFFLYDIIRDDANLSSNLGFLAFGYGPDLIKNAYAHYQPLLKGTILILTSDGGVLFDSSETYYGQIFPNFADIKAKQNGTIFEDNVIINIRCDDEYGFYTIGILPKKDISADINSANRLILLLILVSIVMIMVLSYISTVLFSSRVKVLITSIKRIKHGDLSVRTKISGDDELTEISTNLNLMCDKLNEHINKEYVYQLRQREAELYTLQAQVNPHFLYNSLEAIRMTALKAGNADVGHMVLLLADIYRNSIKQKIIISIRDELNSCKSFLEFYNLRYEGRLDLSYHISDEILDFGILKHLIQPIVENVLVHGINLIHEDNSVSIEGRLKENVISIVIRDNGNGISEDRLAQINSDLISSQNDKLGNIGIFNVNQRIKLIYGEEYGVTVHSIANQGTKVTILIKPRSIEELTFDVQGSIG